MRNLLILVFIGSVAGIVEHLALYPVDTLKVSKNIIHFQHLWPIFTMLSVTK